MSTLPVGHFISTLCNADAMIEDRKKITVGDVISHVRAINESAIPQTVLVRTRPQSGDIVQHFTRESVVEGNVITVRERDFDLRLTNDRGCLFGIPLGVLTTDNWNLIPTF